MRKEKQSLSPTSHQQEIADWYEGLAALDCTFLEVNPETKHTRRPWGHYARERGQRGVVNALKWIQAGSGVGILFGSGLWVLDADSDALAFCVEEQLLSTGIIPLVVRTPSGGAHFYFRFPKAFPFSGMKNHLCHPHDEDGKRLDVDFKLGARTLLVAPGTTRNGRLYEPASPWRPPPVTDPRLFLPHGNFWHKHRPFLIDTRPQKDRIARACRYLQTKAPVSVSGKWGHKTLAGVCAHLVQYLNLDPELAFYLLTHGKNPWNTRCIDGTGKPFPWDNHDLRTACMAAVDSIPSAGVKAWERDRERRRAKARLSAVVGILKETISLPASIRVPVSEVLHALEWMGLPDLTAIALGDELVAQGILRIPSTRARIQCIPGLNLLAMQDRILEADRLRQVQEGKIEGCPLIKQVASLPPVESQVSTTVGSETCAATGNMLNSRDPVLESMCAKLPYEDAIDLRYERAGILEFEAGFGREEAEYRVGIRFALSA